MAKRVKGFHVDAADSSFGMMSNILREPKLDIQQLMDDLVSSPVSQKPQIMWLINDLLVATGPDIPARRLRTGINRTVAMLSSHPERCNNNSMPRDILLPEEWDVLVALGSVPDPDQDLIQRVCRLFCLEDRKDFATLVRETFRQLHMRQNVSSR